MNRGPIAAGSAARNLLGRTRIARARRPPCGSPGTCPAEVASGAAGLNATLGQKGSDHRSGRVTLEVSSEVRAQLTAVSDSRSIGATWPPLITVAAMRATECAVGRGGRRRCRVGARPTTAPKSRPPTTGGAGCRCLPPPVDTGMSRHADPARVRNNTAFTTRR